MRVFANGPTNKTGAALVPIRASMAQAWQSRGPISGSPGTTPIAAPIPAAVSQDYPFQALHKSSNAPAFWRPSVYYQASYKSCSNMSVESDNQMPVPAGTPNGKPAVMSRMPTFLGQQQVGAGNNVATFPWRRG
jgi:hypothetical protein